MHNQSKASTAQCTVEGPRTREEDSRRTRGERPVIVVVVIVFKLFFMKNPHIQREVPEAHECAAVVEDRECVYKNVVIFLKKVSHRHSRHLRVQ